ncbi:SufE family protein [Mesorhizobium sp. RP14(2022)]|uniref:SufE family protein n=1 Tax=Mesorhizobium liriopis TaxID=2953882 RepID=A0ABT1C1B9_9HYPH|nr:SufE family protein [Mesorhizobium liriopis]MCO6048619.1 SufE family protein [Mesorhizobium liriopis]
MKTIQEIRDDFAFLDADSFDDRYRYVIELGEDLPQLAPDEQSSQNKVSGCVSQVWLVTERESGADPVVRFRGQSDAHIVRGLVAIMLALYSGKHASEIVATDAEPILRELGLNEHLTPQRANGLRSMIRRIKHDAQEALEVAA